VDFERAVAFDADFVEALVGIAEANDLLATLGTDPNRYHERTRTAAMKALELDPARARAHTCLGKVVWQHDWDWNEAERHLMRATELDPDDADALIALSDFFCHMARFEEALEAAERAGAINPFSPWIQSLIAQALFLGGWRKEALEQSRQTVQRSPEFGFAHFFLSRALFSTGQEEEAIAELREAVVRSERSDFLGALGHMLALTDKQDEARQILEQLNAAAAAGVPVPPIALAIVHEGLGEHAESFHHLERVLAERSWHILLLNVDPAFEQMRARPEGLALLRQLGLPRS
jgi:tetratricopeptide (TPR) repeat protein